MELDRIESAVDAGDRNLRDLGFWRVVAAVKRDPALIEPHAEQVGRIDGKAFRAGVPRRVPVWVGNLVLLAAAAAGAAAVLFSWNVSEGAKPENDPLIIGGCAVGAGLVWTVAFHSPTHWVVGRLCGIGFTDYFVGGPPPPRPGLKIDYASYLRTAPMNRAWMHASGAIATKLAPFVALAVVPRDRLPGWAAVALLVIGFGSIATDLLFSLKLSDWKKVRREWRLARELRAAAAG